MARDVMVKIGSALYEKGIKETELENAFSFNSTEANRQQVKNLNNRNANGAVIIKITSN